MQRKNLDIEEDIEEQRDKLIEELKKQNNKRLQLMNYL